MNLFARWGQAKLKKGEEGHRAFFTPSAASERRSGRRSLDGRFLLVLL